MDSFVMIYKKVNSTSPEDNWVEVKYSYKISNKSGGTF